MPAYTDTYSDSYLDTYGVPSGAPLSFPLAPLDLRCELQLGGTWTDVSRYVYQREGTSPAVSITRGRPDETQQASPGSAQWQWNNRDGRFSPRNPLSPYYGKLQRSTPVRFSVPATSNYLRLEANNADRAFVADTASLHVTGSLELRAALRLSDWQGGIIAARYDNTLPSWLWQLNADGTLQFSWFDSGGTQHTVNSDAPVPYTSGDFALRVTLDATTATVTFYAGATIGGTFTQIGDALTFGTSTSVRAGNTPLVVGYSFNLAPPQLFGRVYEFRLYNGIGGSIAADGIFSAQAAGTTSWADSAGNTWNLSGGGEISSRDYRYHGLLSSQPPKWDVTGNDQYVAAQAGGPLRILSQGSKPPLMSPLKRAILFQSGSFAPVHYVPMEDNSAATQFGPAIGTTPVTWSGGPPNLAADSSFIASAPLPTLGGAIMNGVVDPYVGGTAWTFRFAFKRGSLPGSQVRLLAVATTGACALLEVLVDPGGTLSLGGWNASGTQIVSVNAVAYPELSGPAYWSLEATPSGGSVQYALVAVAPGATTGDTAGATVSGSAGNVVSYQINSDASLSDSVFGQLQVQASWSTLFVLGSPLNAWQGETAAARFARLAGENGYACRIAGSPALSAAMGPQGVDTLPNLLAECEAADQGQTTEPRVAAALGYRTLASMTGQSPLLTLDYSQSQPGGVSGDGTDSGLDPTYDDLLVRNDWTLTRGSASGSQGAAFRATLDDGSEMSITGAAGDYADTATVNLQADSQLPSAAQWKVHVGTVDEHRWPTVPVNLARPEMTALQGAAMTVDAGDMVQVSSLPNVVLYDPARQLALGFTEQLGGFFWSMQFQCVPASPYDVIILDDPVYGRVDTDGSSLSSPAGTATTTLSVTTAGVAPLWTTSAGDFPFDVNIGGERMTVTAITGSSAPQSFTVTRSVNGVVKSHSAGEAVSLWFPPIVGPW